MAYRSESRAELPAVGDWVVISMLADNSKAIIHAVLPRISKFSRNVTGAATEEQIVAVAAGELRYEGIVEWLRLHTTPSG